MKGFDPLENAKVTPPAAAAAMPPPPPSAPGVKAVPSSVPSSDDKLEKERAAREGTPVVHPEPKPVLVPPAPPARPRPGKYFKVKKSQVINARGSLTTLAKGSIVSEHSHDLESLTQQGVEWEPVDPS